MAQKMDVDTDENSNDPPSSTPNDNDNAPPPPSTQSAASPLGPSSSSAPTASKQMNAAKKAALQQKLKAKLGAYREIVVNGCGDWQCLNEFCASNIANRDRIINDKEASKLAVRMVKLKHSDCPSFGRRPIEALKYQKLKILEMEEIDESKDSADPAISAAESNVIEAFKHWHHLYHSFCTQSAVSEHDVAIDFEEMDRVFAAILYRESLCKDVTEALSVAVDEYLNHLKIRKEGQSPLFRSESQKKMCFDEVRAIMVLMECPLVLSEDIGCFSILAKWLKMVEVLSDDDAVFGAVSMMKEWLSGYDDVDRLRNLVNALHQFITLNMEEQEDVIEDLTDDWKVELKYDDMDDTDAREEVQQEVEKRQQRERERYLKQFIFPAIKCMDIIYAANNAMADKIEMKQRMQMGDAKGGKGGGDEKEEEKKNDDYNQNNNGRRHRVRLSLSIGINNPLDAESLDQNGNRLSRHRPLSRRCFHNDGLNAAICSNSQSRHVIHRRDFRNFQEAEALRAEQHQHPHRTMKNSFLEFPYLLTAGSKAKYLEFENLIRQHRARRRRMLDLMMGGAMGGMIGGLNRNRLMEELDLVLRISRKTIVRDSMAILSLQNPSDLRKRLRIIFDGEQGIDQGGLTKEYFQLIMKELFDPQYGMFIFNASTQCFWFNRDCFELADRHTMLSNYEMVGKLVGIAIYNNTILELRFPRVIFKKLLHRHSRHELLFSDFVDFDPEMAKGFEQLLAMTEEDDIESVYCRNFVVRHTTMLGIEKKFDLLTLSGSDNDSESVDGESVMLSHSNRSQYVELYIEYMLDASIKDQFDAFLRGFSAVCDSQLFQKYDAEELELLICGSKEFDFEALELTTKYEDGLHRNSQIVRDFWAVAHGLSEADKRKLLSFCTGSDRVPINGLGQLALTISKNGGDDNKLPTSHTCFNHLLLPEYSSKDILKNRLLTAIQNSEGFGLL